MNMKVVAGFVLAFLIGVACRVAGVPLPAPPVLIGALLVVAMTVGYIAVDRLAGPGAATQKENCGGPEGTTRSREV